MHDIVYFGTIITAWIIIITIITIKIYLNDPFCPPIFNVEIDITGRRAPKAEEIIDEYINKEAHSFLNEIENHNIAVKKWTKEQEIFLEKTFFKKKRKKQFQEAWKEANIYTFTFVKQQTRYRQHNYVRTSYLEEQIVNVESFSYSILKDKYEKLKNIDFVASINKYNQKNQRKLMTPTLRKQIMERDNYTCQKCGKYMPDEVGLQIDHVIPIAKGGKSIPSNLQVLCSKCNGSKKDKTY